ncbi:MAG: hypothetical protein J5U16_08155 [Candidatus Methanoperedens sp.]|nr:hypothetical protein [Candidatus Methanoperedens sp.]
MEKNKINNPEKYRNHLFMFTRNPPKTAYLLLFFTGLAIVMGIIYEKRRFCRYICLIGLVLGVFSMLSAIELRCKSKKTHLEEAYLVHGIIMI